MKRYRVITMLAAAAVLAAVLPGGVQAQVPELQPGLAEALCPRLQPPDDDCYTIAYPGESWALATTIPIEDTADARAAYDSLIPEPFFPIDGRREVGVLMFRLDVGFQPDRDIDSDPGDGYSEGSVAIRVGFPAEDGYPYTEGWWDLAQPLNDPSQYDAGRGIGLPKYMAEAGLRIDEAGDWRAWATDWADTGQPEPGSEVVPGGNRLELDWTDTDPGVDEEREDHLWTWGQYGEALYVQDPPHDEEGPHDAALVKFTPASVVPLYGAPDSPFTKAPDPRIGTVNLTLEGKIPGSALSFEDLIGAGSHTVAGTSAFTRGYAFLTVDNLENNQEGS